MGGALRARTHSQPGSDSNIRSSGLVASERMVALRSRAGVPRSDR